MMVNKKVTVHDMESVDADYYRSLVWMMYDFLWITSWGLVSDCFSENDITDVLEQTFSVEDERFGEIMTVDLKPDGRDIPVTEENKTEYVKYDVLSMQWIFVWSPI